MNIMLWVWIVVLSSSMIAHLHYPTEISALLFNLNFSSSYTTSTFCNLSLRSPLAFSICNLPFIFPLQSQPSISCTLSSEISFSNPKVKSEISTIQSPLVISSLLPLLSPLSFLLQFTLSSSKVNPLPSLTLVLYLKVCPLTAGLIIPIGFVPFSFLLLSLVVLRLFLAPAWFNLVLTPIRSQCLRRWTLGRALLWDTIFCFVFVVGGGGERRERERVGSCYALKRGRGD